MNDREQSVEISKLDETAPLVSIIALCYNQARFALDTLESIRRQTYPNIELVIIDDASSDDSVEVIEKWISETGTICTFVKHKDNQGLCKTLNEGLRLCKGKYYQAFACDDIMLPHKISDQVNILEESGASLAHSNACFIDDQYRLPENGELMPRTGEVVWSTLPPRADYYKRLLKRCIIVAPSVLIRRDDVISIGGYDEELTVEDLDMWLRLAHKHEFTYIPEPLVLYRRHAGNLTHKLMKATHRWSYFKTFQKQLKARPEYANQIREALRGVVMESFEAYPKKTTELAQVYHRMFSGMALLIFCCRLPFANRTIYTVLKRLPFWKKDCDQE